MTAPDLCPEERLLLSMEPFPTILRAQGRNFANEIVLLLLTQKKPLPGDYGPVEETRKFFENAPDLGLGAFRSSPAMLNAMIEAVHAGAVERYEELRKIFSAESPSA